MTESSNSVSRLLRIFLGSQSRHWEILPQNESLSFGNRCAKANANAMLDSGQVIDAGDSHDHFADVYNYPPSHDHLSIIIIFVVRDVPHTEIAKHAY